MARSIAYWYDYMVAEKNTMASLNTLQPTVDSAQTLLTDVSTTSRVARWRLWLWVVAVCVYAFDVVIDLATLNLELLAKKSRFGSLPWYIQKAYDFQFGDALVYQNNEYQYAVIDPAKQIVKRAAAIENSNTVVVKVAALVSGVPTKLNTTQFNAVNTYFEKLKPAGVLFNLISDDPDDIRLFININYDALILDSTGQLLSTPGTYPVEDAINNYLQNVIFDGTLELMLLVDAMQTVLGVKSAYITSASARYGTAAFVAFAERYYPNAGHMRIDVGTPLNSSITYIPI